MKNGNFSFLYKWARLIDDQSGRSPVPAANRKPLSAAEWRRDGNEVRSRCAASPRVASRLSFVNLRETECSAASRRVPLIYRLFGLVKNVRQHFSCVYHFTLPNS